jgi:hypothetical protein
MSNLGEWKEILDNIEVDLHTMDRLILVSQKGQEKLKDLLRVNMFQNRNLV